MTFGGPEIPIASPAAGFGGGQNLIKHPENDIFAAKSRLSDRKSVRAV